MFLTYTQHEFVGKFLHAVQGVDLVQKIFTVESCCTQRIIVDQNWLPYFDSQAKKGGTYGVAQKGFFFLGRSSTKNVFRREVASYFTYIGKRRKCCVKWLQRRKKSRAKSFLMSCFRATIFSRKSSIFFFLPPSAFLPSDVTVLPSLPVA